MHRVIAAVACAVLGAPGLAGAQTPAPEVTTYRLTGTRIAIAHDIHVERDEEVSDAVVVVGGSVVVDGRVRDGVVVVGGNATLGPSAVVSGDVLLIGGTLTRDPGSRHLGRVNYITLGEWSRRSSWWFPRVRFGEVGRWLSLAGTLARVSLLAVLMGLVLLVARAPVARVGRAAAAEPLRAALVGLLAEIFFVPLLVAASIGLAMTIVGLPFVVVLVPIAIVVACVVAVLGYTAIACRIGEWIEDRLGWQGHNAAIAAALGFAIIIGPTIVARAAGVGPDPLRVMAFGLLVAGLAIEFVAWTIGIGAALLTGLGRWHTAPPPLAPSA